MYDELIKNLRKMQSHEYCVLVSIDGFPAMQYVKEAADAIEKLLASCDNFEAALKDSVEECEKLQQYADLYKDLTERLEKEHAKQCPYYIWNVHDRGDDSMCKKWLCEIKDLQRFLRWIPVTERLPEKDQTVLAYCAEDNFCYISRMHQSFEDYDVTHWIPLPQMPESEET